MSKAFENLTKAGYAVKSVADDHQRIKLCSHFGSKLNRVAVGVGLALPSWAWGYRPKGTASRTPTWVMHGGSQGRGCGLWLDGFRNRPGGSHGRLPDRGTRSFRGAPEKRCELDREIA